jgi:hypothetical protein
MKDEVLVRDHLELTSGPQKAKIAREQACVPVTGFFSCVCRERGKVVPGTRREGHNIWTLAGSEYLARMISYSAYTPLTAARSDRIRYIGFGVGYTTEVASVSRLNDPISYDSVSGGLFLAEVNIPTYPYETVGSYGTSVRYTREFSEEELSPATAVVLQEAGLFTDGSPNSSPVIFLPGSRDRTLAMANYQAPCAYKSFEPLKKTQNFVLQVSWEVRF